MDSKIIENIFNKILDKSKPVLQTGFKELDTIIAGVEYGDIITVASKKDFRETDFLVSIILNLLQENKSCLYCSSESSSYQSLKHFISQLGNIDFCRLNNNELLTETNINTINNIKEELLKLPLTILSKETNLEIIEKEIIANKPNFVFINNLQSLYIGNLCYNKELIPYIMRSLKRIANDNNCIIFILSIIDEKNITDINQETTITNIDDYLTVKKISNVILLITLNSQDIVQVEIAQNDYGPNYSINLEFDPSTRIYKNIF